MTSGWRLWQQQVELRHRPAPWRLIHRRTEGVSVSKSLAEHVAADLAPLGPVRPRPWFGATALTLEGRQFGFTYQDQLYLRASDEMKAQAAAAGVPPFSYTAADGRTIVMRSYCGVPPAVIAEPGALLAWATTALETAVAAAREQGRRSRRGVGPPPGW